MSSEPTKVGAVACRIHGVPLRVTCASVDVLDALTRRLRAFVVDAVPDGLVVQITGPRAASVVTAEALDDSRVVYEGPEGNLRYRDDDACLVADYTGRVQIDVRPRAGTGLLAVTGGEPADLMLAAYPLFTVALLELLKHRGRFALHAACLARAGAGILLAGTSGAGKSTLAAALTRDGFDFLADDTVFLDAAGCAVFAFPDELDVSDATVEMISELAPLHGRAKRPGRPKHGVFADVLGGRTVLECAPAVLVFPTVANAPSTVIEPIGPAEALRELLPNVLLTDALAAQAHLDALAHLARAIPAFRMSTGSVLEDAAAALAALMPSPTPRR